MKKLLVGMVALMAMAGMATAASTVWAGIKNTGGKTMYEQYASVGGYDWSESDTRETGYVYECFNNEGEIAIDKRIHNPGEWQMLEKKAVVGSGETVIEKDYMIWTESDEENPDGSLKWPTEGWIDVEFMTPVPFYDYENAHFVIDQPPAKEEGDAMGDYSYGRFQKVINTDDEFQFYERAGINMCLDCAIPEVVRCMGPSCDN